MEWAAVGALLVILAGLAWVGLSTRTTRSPPRFQIIVDDTAIAVIDNLEQHSDIEWHRLERVDIRTTDHGAMSADLFWGLHTRDKNVVVFPGGAIGETEFIAALQARLAGFDNDELMRAMGSTSHALFTVWTRQRTMPSPGA